MIMNPQNAGECVRSPRWGMLQHPFAAGPHGTATTLCCAIVVVQHPAQTLTAQYRSASICVRPLRQDQPVADSLVVSLVMIMQNELLDPFAQRLFPEPDHPFQTRLLDAAHEPLGVGVQIRRARRQRHRRYPDPLEQPEKLPSE